MSKEEKLNKAVADVMSLMQVMGYMQQAMEAMGKNEESLKQTIKDLLELSGKMADKIQDLDKQLQGKNSLHKMFWKSKDAAELNRKMSAYKTRMMKEDDKCSKKLEEMKEALSKAHEVIKKNHLQADGTGNDADGGEDKEFEEFKAAMDAGDPSKVLSGIPSEICNEEEYKHACETRNTLSSMINYGIPYDKRDQKEKIFSQCLVKVEDVILRYEQLKEKK